MFLCVLFGVSLSKFPRPAITNCSKFASLNNRIYCLTVLDPEVWNWGGGEGRTASAGTRGESFLEFSIILWPPAFFVSVSRTVISASVFTWLLPSVSVFSLSVSCKTLVIGYKAHFNPGWSHVKIFIVTAFAKTLITNKVIVWGTRG